MRRGLRPLWVLAVVLSTVLTTVGTTPAAAVGAAHTALVSAVPGSRTPQILDGRVTDLEEVGNRIVVTGSFTQVQDVAANGGAVFNRTKVFAFDPVTGAVDRAFVPTVTGTAVNAAAAGPGGTVYLGGAFTSVNGLTLRNVAQVSMATGAPTSFRPASANGAVNDVLYSGGRLFLAGVFTTVATVAHGGLATLNASTGALDPYMGVDVAVNHNWVPGSTGARGAVGVSNIDISPNGQRLVAIGNFKQADGLVRDQAVSVLLQAGGAAVDPAWRTRRYEPACRSVSYDSYVRDVEFAPDGSYFVIVTTGAHYAGTLCDTAARWNVSDTGDAVQPRWIADTGGDTLFSVAVSGTAIYVGGHQRWLNNPSAGDSAGPGAVPRPGIAALDPANGIPFSWNPGRNPRGIGAEALLTTDLGLFVGMDTSYFGDFQYLRKRLGFFPLVGGSTPPTPTTYQLPANVYLAGRPTAVGATGVDAVVSRSYNGTTASADASVPTGGVAWSRARGAFMVRNELFYGFPDAAGSYQLVRRTFDGSAFGPATAITTPYLDPAWSNVQTGSGQTYLGTLPNFYGTTLSGVNGMFYWQGRVYYTRSGSTTMISRAFTPESGIISTDFATAGTNPSFSTAAGMFVSGSNLYFATTNGELRRTTWSNGVPGTTSVVVGGPSVDGRNWASRTLFLGPGGPPPANTAPTAGFTSSCSGRTCSFDASGSSDPDGDTLTYAWDFGDGTSGTGRTATRTYAADGDYVVKVTVSDGRGGTASASRTVTAQAPPAGQAIAPRGATGASRATSGTSIAVPAPAGLTAGDGMVLVLTTNSGVTGTAPAGFTEVDRQVNGTATTTFMTTQVFQKVATAGDVGSSVAVTLGASAKATLQLVAYSGTAAAGPVRTVRSENGVAAATTQTTPTTTSTAGDWVLEVWADKSASARTWSAPASVVLRNNQAGGATGGEIASLVADGGVPSTGGTVGGHTATVSAASTRATVVTVVLAPQP